MKVLAPPDERALPIETSQPAANERVAATASSHSLAWSGMLLLIATDATLFTLLLSSYIYLRFSMPIWPPSGIEPPDLTLPLVATVVLLVGSIPMWWAERSISRGDVSRMRVGLFIAFVLSVAFLALQGYEYAHKSFTPQTNVYGSLFFTITGFHGLHVLSAVCMSIVLQVRAALGHFSLFRHVGVSVVALYWHFVGLVWIFILLTVYIFPRLGS